MDGEHAAAIDRIAPTIRPDRRAVMRQDWHHLLFLHWAVPADRLRALLPPGLELDLYEEKAYVGLVPFTMSGVRPVGVPAFRPLSSFHETNVRTYVHVGGRHPGVWFFSLDAASAVAVVLARAWFRLPYHFARMSLTVDPLLRGAGAPDISYSSERRWPGPRPASCAVRGTPRDTPVPALAGSLEHFLVERYILYAARGGRLWRGRVHHAPYPLQHADTLVSAENLLAAAGIRRPETAPLAHYAEGVCVEIFAPQLVQ